MLTATMSLRIRKAFFWLYITLFLIAAPTVVLYTMGFRLDLTTRSLVQTGALSLSTVPRGATVSLDHNVFSDTTPAIVKRTLPGTYHLSFKKEGYQTWERDIEVRSRQTTYVEDVVLFLATEPKLLRSIDLVASAATGNGPSVAYATIVGSWIELWTENVETGEVVLRDRLSAASVSPDQLITMIHELAHPPSTTELYALKETEDGIQLIETIDKATIAVLPSGTYTIEEQRGNLLLFFDQRAARLVLVDIRTEGPPILLNVRAESFHWESTGLLYSDGFEVHRFDPATGNDTLLTRSGVYLQDAVPFPATATVFLVTETAVTAVDYSDPARPVLVPIISAEAIDTFWIDTRGRTGFFVGSVQGTEGIYSIGLTR